MTIVELAWVAAAVAVAASAVSLVVFLQRLSGTLQRLEETMAAGRRVVEELEGEVRGSLQGLTEVEKGANALLEDLGRRLEQLTGVLVPAVEEVSRTAAAYRSLEEELERRVHGEVVVILEEVKRVSGDLHRISGEILKRIDQTKELFQAVEESGRTVRSVTRVARSGLAGLAVQVASMAVGVKSSLEYVTENFMKKGEEKGGSQ